MFSLTNGQIPLIGVGGVSNGNECYAKIKSGANLVQLYTALIFQGPKIIIKIKNELINFILPIEDLDDISKIKEMKNRIEELKVDDFVNKYNIKNYAFTLMNHQHKQLKVHLKTNFNNTKVNKNISYELDNIKDELRLNFILKDVILK